MSRDKPASIAQARRLAFIWGVGGRTKVIMTLPSGDNAEIEPTTRVCIDRGWLVPDGLLTEIESGAGQKEHVLSTKGLDALETFLRDARTKTQRAIR